MLVKPVFDVIDSDDFFKTVKCSKNLPTLDDIKKNKVSLPACYLLPVQDRGSEISSDNRPRQQIFSHYSFCLISTSGDDDCSEESPMTDAKIKLVELLLGFSITEYYTNMSFVEGQIQDKDSKSEIWVLNFKTQKLFKKNINL